MDSLVHVYQTLFEELEIDIKNDVEDLDIPKDIKIILACKFGRQVRSWMNSEVPALGNRKPISYLNTDRGIRALKSAIMRMPD